jgi:hypothetical protein
MPFLFSTLCGKVRKSSPVGGSLNVALGIKLLVSLFPLVSFVLVLSQSLNLLGLEGQRYNHGVPAEIQEVKGGRTLGQTFVAPLPGLHRIDVMLFDRGRRNTHDVTFHLQEGVDASTDIFSTTFNASEIKGGGWHTFDFAPLADSAGKTYYFYFASPESTDGDAIAVGGMEGDLYRRGTAYLYATPANADLTFNTYYSEVPWQQKAQRLLERLAENKPFVWGKEYFYVFLVIVYLLLATILAWQVAGLVLDWSDRRN